MMTPDHQEPNALDNTKPWKRYLFPRVHHEFLKWEGCNRDAKSGYNTKLVHLLPRHIYSLCVVNWDILNRMGCELCHEFYSTYEFDEVCADDKLKTKKIIKFRLSGRAHSLTLLEFARRLGLYHAKELDEEGFDVYIQGGLRSNEYFNAQEYDKIQKNDLWIFSMFDARHQNGYANVAWLIARKARVLSDEVLRSLSAPIYYRDLDTTNAEKDDQLLRRKGYNIPPTAGVYNPPGYAQPQYDQYYQQYPPQQQ
ncbi:hypothetical protein Tco_1047517 [Tanacetum coccineum]